MGDQGKRIEARNCTGRSKLKIWSKTRLQASDDWLYSYIKSDFTHNYVASQKINVKKNKGVTVWLPSFFFLPHRFAFRICIFIRLHENCISINLHWLFCLRNARTTYFIFRNDYLQPLQEGLKEEKEKKTRSSQKKKLSHQAHGRQNYAILTSVRRRHVALTSVRRYFDVLHLLECY